MMKGTGITCCGFCQSLVYVIFECEDAAAYARIIRQGGVELNEILFCDDECKRASALRLDEQVNTCVA